MENVQAHKATYILVLALIILNAREVITPLLIHFGGYPIVWPRLKSLSSFTSFLPYIVPTLLSLSLCSALLYRRYSNHNPFVTTVYFAVSVFALHLIFPVGARISGVSVDAIAFHLTFHIAPYLLCIGLGYMIGVTLFREKEDGFSASSNGVWINLLAFVFVIEAAYLLSKGMIARSFDLGVMTSYQSDHFALKIMTEFILKSSGMLIVLTVCAFLLALNERARVWHAVLLALTASLFLFVFPTGDNFDTPNLATYALAIFVNFFAPSVAAALFGYLIGQFFETA